MSLSLMQEKTGCIRSLCHSSSSSFWFFFISTISQPLLIFCLCVSIFAEVFTSCTSFNCTYSKELRLLIFQDGISTRQSWSEEPNSSHPQAASKLPAILSTTLGFQMCREHNICWHKDGKNTLLSSKSKFQATSAQFMYFKLMVEPGNVSVQMTCWKTDAITFSLSHLLPQVNNRKCTQTPELVNLSISLEAGKNSIMQACQKESKEGVLKICSF